MGRETNHVETELRLLTEVFSNNGRSVVLGACFPDSVTGELPDNTIWFVCRGAGVGI